MGRAKKLLQKLQKNKEKVDKNFNRYYNNLEENSEVFDIVKEVKQTSKKPDTSPKVEVQEIIEDNEELLQRLADVDTEEPQEEITGFSTTSSSLQRVDYEFPNENYGLELIVPPGIITASGIRSGDEVEMLGGSLEGRSLEVIDVLNSTTLRLDDVSTFSNQETGVPVKFILNKE